MLNPKAVHMGKVAMMEVFLQELQILLPVLTVLDNTATLVLSWGFTSVTPAWTKFSYICLGDLHKNFQFRFYCNLNVQYANKLSFHCKTERKANCTAHRCSLKFLSMSGVTGVIVYVISIYSMVTLVSAVLDRTPEKVQQHQELCSWQPWDWAINPHLSYMFNFLYN